MQRTDNPFHLCLLYLSTELKLHLITTLIEVVSDLDVELHQAPVESIK